ncbi:MAG: thiamine phosphate synthase, partial [Bacteroidota bacterium]|nr:thiamine phosphate synthase [Bacteroidota bacterium]
MLNKIQYISQGNTPQQHILNIGNVLDAGCRWIQLRMKNTPDDIILKTADHAKKLCEKFGATFILNDNPILAKEIDSDGVHLGLNDMSVAGAREIIRKNKIIGGTANTIDDII